MDKRFECILEEQKPYKYTIQILKDTETGVLYLSYCQNGLTVMVDKDGKPLTK